MKNLPVVRGCMDQTGQGEPLCEKLQDEFGAAKIEGVIFSPESKETLAIGVRAGLEKREFLLQNDPKFHKQIHSIKRMTTLAGRFRYDAQRDEQGHADSFWAWALANFAITDTAKAAGNGGFYKQYAEKQGKPAKPSSKRYVAPGILSRIGRIR
jgi:phage FluMu gp28-like protein